jgi:hypothetical protein
MLPADTKAFSTIPFFLILVFIQQMRGRSFTRDGKAERQLGAFGGMAPHQRTTGGVQDLREGGREGGREGDRK